MVKMSLVNATAFWTLRLGSEVLAVLWFESFATPWVTVRLEAEDGFERFRGYFGDVEDWPEEDGPFYAMVAEVKARGGFWLSAAGSGEERRDFSLVNVEPRGGVVPEWADLRV